jgi:dTDP-4-amino-4,6-dideoxygalactose transaminase
VHLQEAYADLGLRRGSFALTERLADEILSLPMYPQLERPDIEAMAEALLEQAIDAPAR